ncbi:MAG: DUF192 domain-containing protein [Xenococcaceae cyanobacterium MO_207.B15]|nr:DUF192 domain-containing protein [Xenococcaceae cyanobacterium MO_207.B15]MDJ0743008.1 DUF192 domain-containing protein [Xenococcaceae cyanobacterium MO_167.B27]
MKQIISWGLLSLSVMLVTSCGVLNFNRVDLVVKANESQAQILPITARVNIAGEIIELEVAKTPEEQSKGLMFREELPDNRGMFFPFSTPRITRFWMKNCLVPLDMIFLRDGQVVAIAEQVPPCYTAPEDCPVYGPNVLVNGVLELRSGRAKELNLDIGDNLDIEFLDNLLQN